MERAIVFAAFPHRWTVENLDQALEHYNAMGGPPSHAPETDFEWLANRAFYFNADGHLTKRKGTEWIGESRIGGTTRRAGDIK